MSYDSEFYRRREQQERAIAQCSISPEIGAIHAAMAERYAELAQMPPADAGLHSARATRSSFPGKSTA